MNGVDETLAGQAPCAEHPQQRLDRINHLIGRKRGPDDPARHRRGRQGGPVRSAQGDLVPLGPVLVHAQHADVPTVVVATGIDAPADVKVDVPHVEDGVQVVETLGQFGGDGDGACVGQRAEVAPWAGDHVGDQADVGRGIARRAGGFIDSRQVLHAHPGQQQILIVGHPQFATGVTLGDVGGRAHLIGCHIARGLPRAFDRQRHGAPARHLVRVHIALHPSGVGGR